MSKAKKIGKIILALFLAILLFFGGAFTFFLCMDDSIKSLWMAKLMINKYYIWDMSDDDFLSATGNGLTNQLDAYSEFYNAKELSTDLAYREGSSAGLGITFMITNEGLFIYRIVGGSPAERSGIKEGNYLVAYGDNENSVFNATTYDEFIAYLSGKKENESFLVYTSGSAKGENRVSHTIAKENYSMRYVTYRTSSTAYRVQNGAWTSYDGALSSLPEDTAYVRLTQFYGGAASEMLYAFTQMKQDGKKKLIFDLRSNGGGSLNVLCDIAKFFTKGATEKNPIVAVAKYKDGFIEEFKATDNKGYYDYYFSDLKKITVLADSNTASASECLIGAMVDYGAISYSDILLTEEAGVAKTYGKGIMQTTFEFPFTGDGIKITSAKIYWPLSDTCIHGVGVTTKDGALSLAGDTSLAFVDGETERVIQYLYPSI